MPVCMSRRICDGSSYPWNDIRVHVCVRDGSSISTDDREELKTRKMAKIQTLVLQLSDGSRRRVAHYRTLLSVRGSEPNIQASLGNSQERELMGKVCRASLGMR